jgi:hypothetical protein
MVSVGMLLKKAAKGHLDIMNSVMKVVEKVKSNSIEISKSDSPFAQEEMLVQNLKDIFLLLTGAAFQKYGSDLENHQMVLLGLSDILIESYFTESTLLRTVKNHNRNDENYTQTHKDMTQLFIFNSVEKVRNKAKEIVLSISSDNEKKGLLKSIDLMTRYTDYPNIVELKNKIADTVVNDNEYKL